MFSLADLQQAADVVRTHLPATPQIAWPLLQRRTGVEVWVKHENHLPTGAFKVRGGVVYADRQCRENADIPAPSATAPYAGTSHAGDSAKPQKRRTERGLISATRGNHGQSLAWAGSCFGLPVTIVVPFGNSAEKNAAMEALGATLIEHGTDFEEAREEAHRRAASEGLVFVPSFAPDLVKGVATYALELFQAAPPLDAVYVPVGLGSGICGTILARDLLGLPTQVIGVQSAGADCYARSFAAGHLVPGNRTDTRADGIAVRQPDPEALRIMMAGAERIITVEDRQIAAAIRIYWTDTHNLVEGAGAAPLAGLMQEVDAMRGKRVALIASGGNIDLALFRSWVG
jgi:threonine dehydratase